MTKSDILFQSDLVTILKPGSKRGILVWHKFYDTLTKKKIKKYGLKSAKRLKEDNIDFGRVAEHPYIFFRAPFHNPNKINYRNYKTEIKSLYGNILKDKYYNKIAIIRVDPDKTYVFSSEIRAFHCGEKQLQEINRSKKTLTEYLKIIHSNGPVSYKGMNPYWNLYTSEMQYWPQNFKPSYPWNEYPINKMSEVLVDLPCMKKHYFVNFF